MQVVVADTSPLHYLVLIGHIDLLPHLFETVSLPTEVFDELSHPEAPLAVRSWIANAPAWITVLSAPPVQADEALLRLDGGERAAIALAASIRADLLLMDDRAAVATARARGFAVVGTLGILDAAAHRGLIELREALDPLRETKFRRTEKLFDALLEQHKYPG